MTAAWTEGASIDIQGFERGEVSFICSHGLAWKNNKYICKDPCKTSKDILVTVASGLRAQSGRITLVDWGDGVFTVTFSQLQLSDSGTYWCAVDRLGLDTYNTVHLTVKEGTDVNLSMLSWIRFILILLFLSLHWWIHISTSLVNMQVNTFTFWIFPFYPMLL